MADELGPADRDTIELFLVVGHQLAEAAYVLRAEYVSAQVQLGQGEVVLFTCERGRVIVTGRGFERDLTALLDDEASG